MGPGQNVNFTSWGFEERSQTSVYFTNDGGMDYCIEYQYDQCWINGTFSTYNATFSNNTEDQSLKRD